MNAFQSKELAFYFGLFEKEIERVRFYSDLSKELDGQCWFNMIPAPVERRGDKILVELEYYIGTYYPELDFNNADIDTDLIVESESKRMYFYIPFEADGITEYENRYDRAYCAETITTMTEFALDGLKRIEAAKAAYEQTIAPYHKLPI